MTAAQRSSPSPAAMTMGDPSGIGPEIALKAWAERHKQSLPPFFILADPEHLSRLARKLRLDVPVRTCEPGETARVFATALPVVALSRPVVGTPGKPAAADAALTIESIVRAVELVHAGMAASVVTNPISKDNLYKAGFKHPGHTEFLGELADRLFHAPAMPVMMLWSPELAVVPVTIHIALAQVFAQLSVERVVDTARVVAHDLKTRFGMAKPRLAIAGLNPHAGENGAMGREDIDILQPAVAALVGEGIAASGPYPADTLFHAAARARYDAAICMYHDQALIPIKTLAFDSAVNVTLGLPFVRTSPDHGTAYDIAGTGKASSASLVAALQLAARIAPAPADAAA
ncbi:4-hydroxythreonine-4-phosphate dehydrogenase PdxA [Roseiarcaceae bacterium H3SJ34-1]|uniref:4-hydroxythreonine-4-phosphate dehydrogenase PdxA n=1 Tax=Terripilifer ovatus TaxID=3032367 RepID=UPI003AB96739|nr:4-hydroxythreonine-4-phosphate dehydrogenase PdxA [Roseiarcaceae bacterium H3SJ34-1]